MEEIRKFVSGWNVFWFYQTSASYEEGTCFIYTPNEFATWWLQARYAPLIQRILNRAFCINLSL